MSNPFTPAKGKVWQDLLNEITLAYSERRQTIGQSAYTPGDNKDVQTIAYWTALQQWLEQYCLSFVNHISGPGGAGTSFLFFTLETWREAAGLNASGFRRAAPSGDGNDLEWLTPGLMQADDIIGPWIFEDLQKGFGALKWTQLPTANWGKDEEKEITEYNYKTGGGGYWPTLEDAIQNAKDTFDASGLRTVAVPGRAWGRTVHGLSGGGWYGVEMRRQRHAWQIILEINVPITTAEIWSIAIPDDIWDANGDNVAQTFGLNLSGGPVEALGIYNFPWMGSFDYPNLPTPGENVWVHQGYTISNWSDFKILAKWGFTNA